MNRESLADHAPAPAFARQSLLQWLRDAWTPQAQRVFLQFAGLACCMAISHACSLTNLLLVINALVPNDFGNYSVWLTVHIVLLTVLPMGTTLVIVQEGASANSSLNELWTAQMVIIGTMTLLATALAIAAASLSGIGAIHLAILAGILLSAVAGSLSPFPFFDIDKRQSQSAALVAIFDVVGLMATAAASLRGAISLPFLACLLAAKQLLTTSCQYGYYRRFVRKLAWEPSAAVLERLGRQSWPVLLSTFFVQVPIQGGLLQVNWFRDAEEAGVYAVAAQAMTACIMIGLIAVRVLHPHIAGAMGRQRTFVLKLIAFLVFTLGGIGLGVYSLFFYLISCHMPVEYAFALDLLGPIVVGALLLIVHSFVDLYLLRRGMARTMLVVHGAKAVLYFVATSLVASPFGSYGVASAGLIVLGLGPIAAAAALFQSFDSQWPMSGQD